MEKKIVVTSRDYDLMTNYIHHNPKKASSYSMLRLAKELHEAKIVDGDKTPPGLIGLNSEVLLYEKTLGKEIKAQLVLPKEVSPKLNKISIFSPLALALLGYREGDTIEWELIGTIRRYKVLRVTNS
ncbi:GreA/GreB family elongation factor [Porifericola rhodea]|uniref:GreA/GreB family elongation factor n=1 Tax=Porifericola rhodea TaxID=930972 RepID=UPI00266594AE|nr:GreA/GreB family elongation factor [Porifericola rhodea]WKN31181.1 GreA/GreB family elongation factor [Porifericola rhodea]